VPICSSTCGAKIFVLSLVTDLGFPLLCIFHPLAVKFVLIDNKIWFLRSEVTCAPGD
jgi:hypothetical protein